MKQERKKTKTKSYSKKKKTIIITMASLPFVILTVFLILSLHSKVYLSDESLITSDYMYSKNTSIRAAGMGHFHDGMAKIANADGDIGYIDTTGRIVIEPQFVGYLTDNDDNNFSEGLACVLKDDRGFGYVNKKGTLVIDYQFASCGEFHNGLAPVSRLSDSEHKRGYIDRNGNIAIDYQYKEAGDFSDGLAIVTKDNDSKVVIDTNGNEKAKIDKKYETAKTFSEGTLLAMNGVSIVYLNENGDPLFQNDNLKNVDNAGVFSNGLASVSMLTGGCGYIDRSGNMVLKLNGCSYIGDFHNGLAVVQTTEDNSPRVINKKGETVFFLNYSNIGFYGSTFDLAYSDGLLLVANGDGGKNANYYQLSTDGEIVFESHNQ